MKNIRLVLCFCFIILVSYSFAKGTLKFQKESFGTLSSGESVTLFRLINKSGAYIELIDYGCRVVRVCVPDRNGTISDIIPGYDNIKSFENGKERFFGAVIGRYANRISGASFMIDSTKFNLPANENLGGIKVHLHGGVKGFDRVMWKGEQVKRRGALGIRFTRISPDGEEGYPGNLICSVTYWWTNHNVCKIEYEASTDKTTICNISNHTYFNPNGYKGKSVMELYLKVNADYYFQNNAQYVPQGESKSVISTPFDMRNQHRIDYAMHIPNEQVKMMNGFSVCWSLNNKSGKLKKAADLWDSDSGRGIETWTTEPGLLIYTGGGLNPSIIGKGNTPLKKNGGLILETIHFANSPNRPDFPTTILRPGEKYYSTTEYHFYVK